MPSEPIMNNPALSAHFMPRPRVDGIFERASQSKLVYVIAGSGYGKTQAVRSYIEQQDAVVRWMQLTESDNVGSRYWEHLTYNISHDNPDLSARLLEFGFPDTTARFNQFAEILKSTEHRSHKTFLVLDDFHLIDSEQALTFAERCAHLKIPGACVIIISRTQPEINAVSLFAKGQVSIITEDELRFTEAEISQFLGEREIIYPAGSIKQLAGATGGWALAVQLLSLILKRGPKSLDIALESMKQSIFQLMESEAFDDFPEDIKKTMVRLSLVSELPLKMLWNHFSDGAFLQNAPQLAAFVWFDSFTGQDRVHPLYWEFLRSKQDILTYDEKQEVYKEAAQWCSDNNLFLDSIKYLAASRQFERMLVALLSYPVRMPHDTCEYLLDIVEGIDADESAREDMYYLLLSNMFIPLLLSGAGKYEQAGERCFEAIREWENKDDPVASLILGIAYSNLSYIDTYTCTITHKYDAAEHLKKSTQYMKNSSVPPVRTTGVFAVADIRSFACTVGEGAALTEFDEYLKMSGEISAHTSETSGNMYYGYDDLVACELAFYKNKAEEAKRHANEAIRKAREKGQFSIDAMAAMYLFRIAMTEGDYPLVRELFRQKDDSPESPYFWNRKFLYELGIGFIFAHMGIPEMEPQWLVSSEKEPAVEVTVPVRELICSARYHIAAKKYSTALTLLCAAHPRKPQDRFLLGELTLSVLEAAARINIGDAAGAAACFTKAYELSYNGVFEMPFVELGKDMHHLAVAVSGQPGGFEAQAWLKTMDRKASVYAKNTAIVLNSFRKEQHIEDSVKLSQREMEVLSDLYNGLSREEIAVSRFLSINTVHKIIQSVFIKLDAKNKADAIRIAVDNKLV